MTAEQILEKLIYPTVDEFLASAGSDYDLKKAPDARLFGPEASLDSLGFVTLIVSLEQKIEEVLGRTVRLVNAKALSSVNSPFRDLGSLAKYVADLLQEPA